MSRNMANKQTIHTSHKNCKLKDSNRKMPKDGCKDFRRRIGTRIHEDFLEYSADCCSDLEYSTEDDSTDEESTYEPPSVVSLNLWSAICGNKDDDSIINEESDAPPRKLASSIGKDRNNGTTVTNRVPNRNVNEESLLLEQASSAKPRLVRSDSMHVDSSCDGRHSLRQPHRSASISTFTTITRHQPSRVAPSTYCIQNLLPSVVRPCIVGPTPGASLDVVSCRAAVVVLWSLNLPLPVVVPMAGCGDTLESSWNTANKMQSVLRQRVSPQNNGLFAGYLRRSEEIASRLDEWIRLLDEQLPKRVVSPCPFRLLTPICNGKGISFGSSNDRFDLLRMVKSRTSTLNLTTMAESQPDATESSFDENHCPVCFDDLSEKKGVIQLIPCAHSICSDCFIRYVDSAAGSGHGALRCVAFKCPTRLTIYDIAHALFDGNYEKKYDRAVLFDKLARFDIEKSGMDSCQSKARYCPSPSCSRVLVSCADGDDSINGSNIFACPCGITLCADSCNENGSSIPSHPGIPCDSFRELSKAIDSGKLDAEVANIQWMLKHSRSCPKCRYPIEKNGGCNHVRCSSCQFYFCWHCGGPGNECMASYCNNKGKYSHQEPGYNEEQYGDLVSRINRFRNYRNAAKRLASLQKTLANNNTRDKCIQHLTLLDIQLTQVALWIYGRNLINNVDHASLQTIELMMDVLFVRKSMVRNRLKTAQEGSYTLDEVMTAMGFKLSLTSKAKTETKIRHQALEQMRALTWNDSTDPTGWLFSEHDFQDLCTLPDATFERIVSSTLKEAITCLIPKESSQVSWSKKSREKKDKVEASGRLNIKLKRPSDPWRNGWRRERSVEEHGDENECYEYRWKKGKRLVSSRRQQAIEERLI